VATTQAALTDAEQEGNDQASHPTTADDSQLDAQEVSNRHYRQNHIFHQNSVLFWTLFNIQQVILVLQYTQFQFPVHKTIILLKYSISPLGSLH